jgi:hypothetical protein
VVVLPYDQGTPAGGSLFLKVDFMCYGDLLRILNREGPEVTDAQLCWAMTSSKLVRPPLDGSLRFDFGEGHVVQLRDYFLERMCE